MSVIGVDPTLARVGSIEVNKMFRRQAVSFLNIKADEAQDSEPRFLRGVMKQFN
jgi:hypothetical protein